MIERTRPVPIPEREILSPEVMVPPAIFLATQDAKGQTGASIVAKEWSKKQ